MNTNIIDLHGGHADPDAEKPTSLLIIQCVFIPVVMLIAIVSGVLPAKIQSCKQSQSFLGLANAFSGGLFLAIALIHILPEAVDGYGELWEE